MLCFLLYCDTWSCSARVWEVCVFRHADVCLCLVCILWQFSMLRSCMTCSLLMLVEDARGDHMEEAYSRAGVIIAL